MQHLLPDFNKTSTYVAMISCKIYEIDMLYINKGLTAGDNIIKNIAHVFISNRSQTDTIIRIRENLFIRLTPFSSITALRIQHRHIKSSILHTINAIDIFLDVDISYRVLDLSEISLEQVISSLISEQIRIPESPGNQYHLNK